MNDVDSRFEFTRQSESSFPPLWSPHCVAVTAAMSCTLLDWTSPVFRSPLQSVPAAPHERAEAHPVQRSIGRAARKSSSVTCAKSSTPDGTRKRVKPNTPASWSARESPALPGTTPPQKPTFTQHFFRAALRLVSSLARQVVCRRNAVERHVDQRRHSAGGSGARGHFKAFPSRDAPARRCGHAYPQSRA